MLFMLALLVVTRERSMYLILGRAFISGDRTPLPLCRPSNNFSYQDLTQAAEGKTMVSLRSNLGNLSSTSSKYSTWRFQSGSLFRFNIGGLTDELHLFTKSTQTGLSLPTVLTTLLSSKCKHLELRI